MTPPRPNTSAAPTAAVGPPPARRLDRPVGIVLTALLILGTLLAPQWLLRDHLEYPALRGDDFAFLMASRSGARPLDHLFEPHNAHVVPAFRLLTAGLARAAGSLGNVATAFSWASSVALGLLMLNVAHLVGWETRRLGPSLAAMALIGVGTVLTTPTRWYAAGQTLWAAQAVVATLLPVQLWRLRGGWWLLALGAVGAFVAPLFWTGGLVAGPAAAAYLWATRQPAARRAAVWPLLGTGAAVGFGLILAGSDLGSSVQAESVGLSAPFLALGLTAQAIVEALVLGLFGLAGSTTPAQALALVSLAGVAWWASRRGSGPVPNPLEAAGLVMVVLGYGLAFTLRSRFDYANLRELAWYNTIPFAGLVVFLAGWWSARRGRLAPIPGRPQQPTVCEALGLVALVAVLLLLHVPRAQLQLLAQAPPMLPSELKTLPIPELQRLRARIWDEDVSGRQRRALIRLEAAAAQARGQGVGRDRLRAVLGRIEVPGWPAAIADRDALDLVDLPETTAPASAPRAAALAATLAAGLRPEAPLRPTWIQPGDPWPPPDRPAVAPPSPRDQDGPAPPSAVPRPTNRPTGAPSPR